MTSRRVENGIIICSLKKICAYLESFSASRMVDTRRAVDQIGAKGLTLVKHCAVKTQYFAAFPNDVGILSASRCRHFAQTSISNEFWQRYGLLKWLVIYDVFY